MEERSETRNPNATEAASGAHETTEDPTVDPTVDPTTVDPTTVDPTTVDLMANGISQPFDDESIDDAPAPDDDPDVRSLRRRDRAFVFRVSLRAGVALLLGIWIFLQLTSADVGACAARGFGTVTG